MKVTHIITGLSTGGAERMLVKLIRESKTNVTHNVISLNGLGRQGEILLKMGVTTNELLVSGLHGLFPSTKKLFKLLDKANPDLIQGWMYHGNLAAIVGGKLLFRNVPVLFNIRHSLYDIQYEKTMTQWMIRANAVLSRFASRIIYNSRTSKNQHEDFGYTDMNSVVIPNGFDTKKYVRNNNHRIQIRNEFGIAENAVVFGQVGRNHPMKNHDGFLKAASLVLKNNDNAHFLLVGTGINKSRDLRNLIIEHEMGHNVTLVPERDDIERIWNAVDIAVLSSKWGEAFPNVLGEAMLCEKPCITTDIGDSKFIVGETGTVVDPNNPKLLAEAMMKFLRINDNQRLKMGKEARERIENNFSIKKITNQYINLYKELIK